MNYIEVFLINNPPVDTLAQKLSLSGLMLLKGMGTVFFVLIILWGIISLFSVFADSGKKKKDEKEAPAIAEEAAQEAADTESEKDDGELVAVITAAVEAYRASEGKAGLPYRVVSFKRKSGTKRR